MASIYTNAVCTLAALNSADGTEGCRVRDAPDPLYECDDGWVSTYQTADFGLGDIKIRVSEHSFVLGRTSMGMQTKNGNPIPLNCIHCAIGLGHFRRGSYLSEMLILGRRMCSSIAELRRACQITHGPTGRFHGSLRK